MAQWQELLRLDSALQSQVSQLYEKKFPREIRHYLCVWIESQDWDSAAVDEQKANSCFHAFLSCLEEQWNRTVQEKNILQAPDFSGMKAYLENNFQNRPQSLAILLSECLKKERNILTSVTDVQRCGSPGMEQNWKDLDNRVNELKPQTLELKKEIKTLESLNEKLDFAQKTWQNKVEQHNGLAQSHPVVEEEVMKRELYISQIAQMVLGQIFRIVNDGQLIVDTLTKVELPQWKHRQQMACIGSPVDTSLDRLQNWFTTVAEVLLGVLEQLQKLREQNSKYSSIHTPSVTSEVIHMEKFVLSVFMRLVTNAMVVEKQPVMNNSQQRPLILKTGVQFKAIVRVLVNLPELKLKVKPIFDKDVEEAKTNGFRPFVFNRDDSKILDDDSPDGGLRAEFGHMSLKEKERKTKSKVLSENRLVVTEELHIIKFVTVYQYAGQRCNIEASSLPVIVISSSSQVSSAWASIIWWNMLSTVEPWNLSLFADPPPLPWQQLSKALSWQFLSVGQRELDENQLSMLRDKIVDPSTNPDDLVQWSAFSKNESAWMWIDGILDLIKKHMVDIWRDGSIMGFVSRERTRQLLDKMPTGTFLIRFSESIKDGAITFSWVDNSNGEPHVHAVEPYTKKELQGMSLPQIIYHYSLKAHGKTSNPLLYLYPDIHKDVAFGRYYKLSEISSTVDVNGYINRKLASVSVCPTPPPSPPRDMNMMEVDTDTNIDLNQLLADLFSDFSWTPYTDNYPLCPLSLPDCCSDDGC